MNSASNIMEIDAHLSQLLGTLSLDSQRRKSTFASEERRPSQTSRTQRIEDATMSDSSESESEDSTYQPSYSISSSASTPPPPPPPLPPNCGCAYLRAVHDQIRAGKYSTTSGDYLETIFTHREVFFACPQAHRTCAVGFSDLARDLERRDWYAYAGDSRQQQADSEAHVGGWRPDWEGDHEAVVAFRQEAWVIANAF